MMTRFCLKLIFALLFFVPIVSIAQQTTTNNQLDFLRPLVGEKCAVHLKSGDVINGTLWVYGHDYISLKVKKGLLYSKTEKYAVSEIDYIKDTSANRYYMPKVSKLSNEKPPTRLYISPDASDEKEQSGAKTEFQGTFRFLKSGEKKASRQAETKSARQRANAETFHPKTAKKTPLFPNLNTIAKPTPKKTPTPKQSGKSPTVLPAATKALAATHEKAANSEKGVEEPRQQQKFAATAIGNEAKQLKVLKYQTFVLFGCAALIVSLLLIFKVTGLKGATYGKYTLFPSRVIKIEGEYGIIDQGQIDGVKTDDILRLYEKSGSHVQYKAKVKVKKVGENYSVIQLVNLKSGHQLEPGDVGFRDRNFLVTSWKRLRIIMSATLRGLARGIQYTASNLDVKSEEVGIDLRPPKVESKESRKVKTVNRKSSNGARKKQPVTTVDATQNSKPVGFGLD